MSLQVSNSVILNNRKFDLIESTNKVALIKPDDFGMIPLYRSSRCMRGYVTIYEVNSESILILKELYVKTKMNDNLILINGIPPALSSKTDFQSKTTDYEYKNLNLATDYSGHILIGEGFISSLNTKFSHPAVYQEVFELEINEGIIRMVKNLSKKMAEYRLLFKEGDYRVGSEDLKMDREIKKWFV